MCLPSIKNEYSLSGFRQCSPVEWLQKKKKKERKKENDQKLAIIQN